MVKQRADLTFKYNLKRGRHGWIRLTPAYSIKIVRQILADHPEVTRVLDPFSGTGTTGLVCAERGIRCDLIEINPFLVWLARAKTAHYTQDHLRRARVAAQEICDAVKTEPEDKDLWVPPIHNVHRWWHETRLSILAKVYHQLQRRFSQPSLVKNILLVAFCNLIITWSNAAFNHQSMSFKDEVAQQLSLFDERERMLDNFVAIVHQIAQSAEAPLAGQVRIVHDDARKVAPPEKALYDCVITSPPYPNRMSYIRELRPYMYWLGYLESGRQAGELDWQAIGGTWGIATSRLKDWEPANGKIPHADFGPMVASIAEESPLLANYVHRYFVDVQKHFQSLFAVLAPGAKIFYIVGNSRFYETLVPVEAIYVSLLEAQGFVDATSHVIRKRNSKKELFEFVVSARRP